MTRPCRTWLLALLMAEAALPQGIEKILGLMDQNAPAFRSLSAQVEKVAHTAVIDDDSREKGAIRMLRVKPRDVRFVIEFTEPDPRSVAFAGRKAELYYPKIQTVHEYDLGKHRSLVDQFMLLGFGTSGKELSAAYTIKLVGQETVSGEKTWQLELIPRSAKTAEHLKKVELWISDPGGHPVRQRFHQPSGDHTTITYSEITLNSDVTEDSVRLRLPSGTKREYPQK